MGRASRERAEQMYQWANVVKQYDELWDELHSIYISEQKEKKQNEMIFMEPSYYRIFNPYVSDTLENNTNLHITAEGIQVCKGELEYVLHYDYEKNLLESDVANKILKYIFEVNDTLTIQSIVDYFNEYNDNLIKRGIMKLVKQGFVSYKKS